MHTPGNMKRVHHTHDVFWLSGFTYLAIRISGHTKVVINLISSPRVAPVCSHERGNVGSI